MNTANKITILRILLIPVFMLVLMLQFKYSDLVASLIFAVAAATDGVDGYVARKYNQVTDFGKFIDPVADKLLVLTTLIMLIHINLMEAWVVVIILCRELAVDGLRMVAVSQGNVIAASPLGKWKTTFQMITIVCILLLNQSCFSTWYTCALTIASIVLTLSSAVDYFYRNSSFFSTK